MARCGSSSEMPVSRSRQASAGSPSKAVTRLRSQAVTRRMGPTGWQPCVTRETRATSRLNATPDRPPWITPSAIWQLTVRDELRPPNR